MRLQAKMCAQTRAPIPFDTENEDVNVSPRTDCDEHVVSADTEDDEDREHVERRILLDEEHSVVWKHMTRIRRQQPHSLRWLSERK